MLMVRTGTRAHTQWSQRFKPTGARGEWASALVIQEKTARTKCQMPLAGPKGEQAARRPMVVRTEKAVRKLTAPQK
jgi:hypothetical protein